MTRLRRKFFQIFPDQIDLVNTDVSCNEEHSLEKLFDESECDASLAALTLQHNNPLKEFFEVAEKEDSQLGRNYYYLERGLLLRHCYDSSCPQEPDLGRTQIVVPTSLRDKVLELAHSNPAAGHLGMIKTKARLSQHFFWPSLKQDVQDHVRTCDMCQQLDKRK